MAPRTLEWHEAHGAVDLSDQGSHESLVFDGDQPQLVGGSLPTIPATSTPCALRNLMGTMLSLRAAVIRRVISHNNAIERKTTPSARNKKSPGAFPLECLNVIDAAANATLIVTSHLTMSHRCVLPAAIRRRWSSMTPKANRLASSSCPIGSTPPPTTHHLRCDGVPILSNSTKAVKPPKPARAGLAGRLQDAPLGQRRPMSPWSMHAAC